MNQDKLFVEIENLLRKAMEPVQDDLGPAFEKVMDYLADEDLGLAFEAFLHAVDKRGLELPPASEALLAKAAAMLT